MEQKNTMQDILLKIEAEIDRYLLEDPTLLDPIHCQNNVAVVISHRSPNKMFPYKIVGITAKEFYKTESKSPSTDLA